MNSLVINPIANSIPFTIRDEIINIQHPISEDIPKLVSLLKQEDLDLRRMVSVSQEHYPSKGKKWVYEEWDKKLKEFNKVVNSEIFKQLSIQAEGILLYKPIFLKGTEVLDPFNMKPVEVIPIKTLAHQQIKNIIVAKIENEIIGMGRLLEVEGSVEIVSLYTKPDWRGKGIATKIINELLRRSVTRPIFSFQVPKLIPFYLKRYQKHGVIQIEPFTKLPSALQRDLFHMNIFWGPYTIISII